jgi:hypothetical protein
VQEPDVIERHDYTQTLMLICDNCDRRDFVNTAKTEDQARRVAEAAFRWAMGTEHGDLCPRCAALWRSGGLDHRL